MRLPLALLLLSLITHSGWGQSNEEADSLLFFEHDPAVITGTRIEVARSNVPLTVSTVSGAVLRGSGETNVLPVVSRRVPGVFVTERGVMGYGIAGGAAGRITIRGVGGSPGDGTPNTNVLVMVDGHPQFMGIFGHPFPDAYASSDAARVEVVRGPASILYGTAAMGGVINIITNRSSHDGIDASASAAYGSFQTQHYGGAASLRRSGREAVLSVNHDRTNGHRDALDDFALTNAYLKVGTPLSSHWRVTADGRMTRFHTEDPGPSHAPNDSVAQDADVLRGRVAVSLENRHERVQGAVKAFYNFGEHEIFDGFRSEDFNGGIVAYEAFRVAPGLVTTVGLDWKRYGGSSRNVLGGADFGDHAVSELGGYGFVQYAPLADLMLSGGARVERHSLFGEEIVPQIGAAYHLAAGTSIKASVAQGFRSPTILELYLFPPANPDLEPERMWNYEVGLSYGSDRMSAELVGFISEGSNLIEVRMSPLGGPLRRNVGAFTNRGIELQAAFVLTRALQISGNLSYLDKSTPIAGAPDWHGFADLTYASGPLAAGFEVEWVSGLLNGGTLPGPGGGIVVVEDYVLANARASYRPIEHLELFARLENLLDTEYQINAGYPMPGMTIMTGLRIRT